MPNSIYMYQPSFDRRTQITPEPVAVTAENNWSTTNLHTVDYLVSYLITEAYAIPVIQNSQLLIFKKGCQIRKKSQI